MTADEIIADCNPCGCVFPDKSTIAYVMYRNSTHRINCTRCGFDAWDADLQVAIEKWNSVNIDAPVVLDPCGNCGTTEHIRIGQRLQTDFTILDAIKCNKCHVHVNGGIEEWNARQAEIRMDNELYAQAYAIATGGNAEQTAAQYEAKNQDRFWRSLVKRTPELPADNQRVLLWYYDRWIYTFRDGDHWVGIFDSEVNDGQYWLPMPSFNPEREG